VLEQASERKEENGNENQNESEGWPQSWRGPNGNMKVGAPGART